MNNGTAQYGCECRGILEMEKVVKKLKKFWKNRMIRDKIRQTYFWKPTDGRI